MAILTIAIGTSMAQARGIEPPIVPVVTSCTPESLVVTNPSINGAIPKGIAKGIAIGKDNTIAIFSGNIAVTGKAPEIASSIPISEESIVAIGGSIHYNAKAPTAEKTIPQPIIANINKGQVIAKFEAPIQNA